MIQKSNTAVICFSPYFGGMELDAIRYARLLTGSASVIFIAKRASHIDKNFNATARQNKIVFESIPFSTKFSLSIIFHTRRIINQYNVKNVIFFGASEMRSLYFAFLNKDINLIIRHGTTKSHPKKDPLHRLIYSNVSWHIPICRHIEKNVYQIIPFGRHTRLKVIYPSLRHLPERFPTKQASRVLRLLHVSRIAEGKGHLDAIDACKQLYESNIPFKLIFVGQLDPNFAVKLNEKLDNCPYRNNIQLTGYTDKVSHYYENADIFIFPSKGEGLSNAFIEALAYGLLCIAYCNTSFPELREAGFEFFMARDSDLSELTDCLMQATESLKQNKFPVEHNIKLAGELFDKQRELNEIFDILV